MDICVRSLDFQMLVTNSIFKKTSTEKEKNIKHSPDQTDIIISWVDPWAICDL